MSDIAYRGLLFEIGKKLTQHDRQQLLVVCGLEDEADNIPDAHLLLERLHEKGLLEIDQLGVLEEVLATLDESSLLEKLKEFEKKRKEYTNLLAKVSDALDSDERNHLEQLKDICKRETSLELDESISEIRTLFKELEKHGRLGFRTLDFLKKILTEIEREDLVKEIEEYEERRNKNDAGERRKAKLYSWGKAGIEKAAQVPLKTWVEAFGRVVSYNDILGCFKSVGQCFRIFDERVLIPDTELVNMSRGSVCFTVQANSLKGLTTLWKMYQDGTLRARLYDFLVTEVKHFAEAEENVELTVTIEEEDYKRAFIYLNNEAKEHTPRQTQANSGMHPPLRPGYGTKGRPIALRANFFRLNVSPQLSDLYHYDVEITPERCPKSVKRDIVNEIIKKHKQTTFQGHHPAFDGEKNLYSRIKLPVPAELSVKLPGEDGGRDRVFKVKIQFAAAVSLLELNNFLSGEQNGKIPQDAVQALDIVVRQMPSMYYTPVGRSFFPFDGQGRPLGEGCEVKFGFYSSIRHSEWKAMLVNIDVSAKGFYKEQAVVPDFLREVLDVKPHNLEDYRFEPDRRRLEKAIRGIRIQTTHAGTIKRKYTIWGVSEKSANRKQFDVTDERTGRTSKTTVADYFKDRYRLILRYPHLPCLQVGQKKDRYLPMEVCTIIPAVRKHLSEQQTANMIRSTARPAPERQRDIQHWAQEMTRASSKYLRDEFQTSVGTEMVKVEGRVLPPPKINLGPQDQPLTPRDGSWDMRNKSLHDGARIEKWALACFCGRCRDDQLRNFSKQMGNVSSRQGLRMSEEPVVVRYGRGAREVESLFSKWVVDIPGLQLIMAILPERDKQIYPEIKRVGDNVIGIPTQCVQSKHVNRTNPQVCANIALKINSKLGGINHVIDPGVKSPVFREPVIIFGADVTHPSPTENGIPSIAAVVASMDANATKYCARVRAQNHKSGKGAQEIINDLAVMVKELLIDFYKANRKLKPNKIIFYRDGVSEGQFDQVLVHEVRAVQQACIMLEKDYRPRITFVVVQKRHHTRLFCENQRDEVGKARNVPPGTTVDSGITHPYEFDFYLCSHYGIQGTSRPTHYHVLYDDNSFTADGLQQLTYQLCHVYARCTRSVSMPAPAYYAHLVAFRARHHVTGNGSIDLEKSAKAIEVNAKMKGAMYFT